MVSTFPYEQRAAAARRANEAIKLAFAEVTDRLDGSDPKTIAWHRAIDAAWAMIDAAYPPGFGAAVEKLRRGKPDGIDMIIAFLEADPIFFRSGYVKEDLIRYLNRIPLDPTQAKRLRGVVKLIVRKRDAREFRRYCRLACRVDTPGLRSELAALSGDPDKDRRRRANWMLEALARADREALGRHRASESSTP